MNFIAFVLFLGMAFCLATGRGELGFGCLISALTLCSGFLLGLRQGLARKESLNSRIDKYLEKNLPKGEERIGSEELAKPSSETIKDFPKRITSDGFVNPAWKAEEPFGSGPAGAGILFADSFSWEPVKSFVTKPAGVPL